jgi:hypothetical protein
MISELVHKRSTYGRTETYGDVRETNLGCQRFLFTAGYRAYGVTRGAYEDTREAAYEFAYDLERVLTQ